MKFEILFIKFQLSTQNWLVEHGEKKTNHHESRNEIEKHRF